MYILNYKEPANGNFGDCTKEVLANIYKSETVIRGREQGVQFQTYILTCNMVLIFACLIFFLFARTKLNFAIILKSRKLVLAKISKNRIIYF